MVPIDTFLDRVLTRPAKGVLHIHNEEFQAVVVPFAEILPEPFIERLCEFAESGIRVVFMRGFPIRSSQTEKHFQASLARLRANPFTAVLDHDILADQLSAWKVDDIRVADRQPHLRHYHYVHADEHLHFFVNESTRLTVDTRVRFRQKTTPTGYDALNNTRWRPSFRSYDGGIEVDLCLEPYESTFIVFGGGPDPSAGVPSQPPLKKNMSAGPALDGPWTISIATAKEFPAFKPAPEITGLENISAPDILPSFSGTVRYETGFEWVSGAAGERVFLDCGEVFEIAAVNLNGGDAGVCITPPYRVEITGLLRKGANSLRIDVTNTLVKQYPTNLDRVMPQEPSGLIGPVHIRIMKDRKDEPQVSKK